MYSLVLGWRSSNGPGFGCELESSVVAFLVSRMFGIAYEASPTALIIVCPLHSAEFPIRVGLSGLAEPHDVPHWNPCASIRRLKNSSSLTNSSKKSRVLAGVHDVGSCRPDRSSLIRGRASSTTSGWTGIPERSSRRERTTPIHVKIVGATAAGPAPFARRRSDVIRPGVAGSMNIPHPTSPMGCFSREQELRYRCSFALSGVVKPSMYHRISLASLVEGCCALERGPLGSLRGGTSRCLARRSAATQVREASWPPGGAPCHWRRIRTTAVLAQPSRRPAFSALMAGMVTLAFGGTSGLCPLFVPRHPKYSPESAEIPALTPRMETPGKIGISSEISSLSRARKVSVAPMMDYTDRHCRYFLRLLSPNTLLYRDADLGRPGPGRRRSAPDL